MTTARRILIMTTLAMSGGVIYTLPFLREVYYQPMQDAFGFSHTELGLMMSVFGALALIGYFPGGWLADQFSPRKLITIAMLVTGFAGLYFATFPSFVVCLVLHAIWGLSSSLIFWGALIKATRNWSSEDAQGKGFGILEFGRGTTEIVTSTVFLALFAFLGATDPALSTVILLIALINCALGILSWFLLDDELGENISPRLHEILIVLKMPQVWLIAFIVMSAYIVYWGTFYFTPLASDVYMMGVVLGGAVGVGKMWLKPFTALACGYIADRFGVARSVMWLFVIGAGSYLGLIVLPVSPDLLPLLLIAMAIAAMTAFGLRGIYFALLCESRIPIALTGTATGVISMIGFAPDVFMPLVGGVLLDAYPDNTGYQLLFACIVGVCILGTGASLLVMKMNHKQLSQ